MSLAVLAAKGWDNHAMQSVRYFITAAHCKFVNLPDFKALQAPLQARCDANEVKDSLHAPVKGQARARQQLAQVFSSGWQNPSLLLVQPL